MTDRTELVDTLYRAMDDVMKATDELIESAVRRIEKEGTMSPEFRDRLTAYRAARARYWMKEGD